VSVDSGLSVPVEPSVADPGLRRETTPPQPPVSRARRRRKGEDRADVLADAVSTPSFRTQGRGRQRRRGRRVKRVVRRIELWSVLKVSLVFNTVMLGVALGSVALLWGLANTTGLIDDLEGFLRDSGFEDFRFQGDTMFQQVAFIGAVVALAFTVFTVLATALLNLISEITGGIRFVVIEEIVEHPAAWPTAPAPPGPPVPAATAPPAATGPPAPRPAAAGPPAARPAGATRRPSGRPQPPRAPSSASGPANRRPSSSPPPGSPASRPAGAEPREGGGRPGPPRRDAAPGPPRRRRPPPGGQPPP